MTYSPDSLVCTRNDYYPAELENEKKKLENTWFLQFST